jgi:signal transduction histidine kinase
VTRYVATTFAVAVAAGATLILRPWMGPSVSILFFPAIIFAAMYGGYGASLLAALLSTGCLAFFIIPPYNSFDVGTDDALRLAVFALVAIVTASVSSARQRAEALQRDAFRELQHGIATLRKVSGWPLVVDTSVAGGIRKVLAHAANVIGAECAIAVWETEDEPWVFIAASAGSPELLTKYPPSELTAPVHEDLTSATLLGREQCGENVDVTISRDGSVDRWHGTPVHKDIAKHLGGRGFASAPFEVEHHSGRTFFSGLSSVTQDAIPLVEVVAREVGNSLEQLYAHDRLQQLAIREDRLRVARDLHDGVLQSLTGARFQLQLLADDAPSTVRDRLLAVERAIAIEQRELRLFIDALRPELPPQGAGPLANRLETERARLAAEWKTPISLRVEPADMALPPAMEQEVRLMVREAVVNALKHAQPSRVAVEVKAEDSGQPLRPGSGQASVQIVVSNDGRGFPFRGRYDHEQLVASNAGPVSLRDRVHSLSGTLAIESMPTGSRVEISVPI